MSQAQILVVEDDAGLREALIDTLMIAGYQCIEADSGEAALVALNRQSFDLVISDIQMGGMNGITLLQNIKAKYPETPVLLMTAYATIDDAVTAMRDGAIDYLAKPFAPEVLLNQVSRYAPAQKCEKRTPVFGDETTKALLNLAAKVAKSDASVMVTGPSGAGKEIMARYIHDMSPRAEQNFVAINCAAIPDNMLEATLFGYEKGAFTGAVQACPGKFEQAQGGTILLDEITEMDLNLQAKLLRVLQEKEVERLGGRKTVKLDVRVLATSNRDLKQAVQDGVFREDLYYRLNVFPIKWLPLHRRRGDIIPLAKHLITRHHSQGPIPELTQAAADRLYAYSWPGNVRELDNVVQRALILAGNQDIELDHLILEDELAAAGQLTQDEPNLMIKLPSSSGGDEVESYTDENLGEELKHQEHQIIIEALKACAGKRKDVAEKLGISPRTLRYKMAKMKEMGVEIPV